MGTEEVQALRIYHEGRCEQERRRMQEAGCEKAAAAHAHLFSLHRLRTIDVIASPPESGELHPSDGTDGHAS